MSDLNKIKSVYEAFAKGDVPGVLEVSCSTSIRSSFTAQWKVSSFETQTK